MAECDHSISPPPLPETNGCQECLATGGDWVHLRLCRTCGHVGCCDSSPNQHATAHHRDARHPVVQSFEPGEDWGWCYIHQERLGPYPPASRQEVQ